MTKFSTLLRSPICAALISVLIGVACGQAPVDETFTYQGQLKQNGVPLTGTANLDFSLWDAASGGTQIEATLSRTPIVVDGQFTVQLNFGGAVFNGDERWLQIAVNGMELSSRQEFTATPYASYALSAGSIPGGLFGDSWTGSSETFGLSITNTSTAFGAKALYGHASGDSGRTYGLYGRNRSTSGTGVYGLATASSGETYGVYGFSSSSEGHGVHGLATAITGQTHGVHGASASTVGRGVYGHATSTTGGPVGVYGESDANLGTGVYGTSEYIGVFGEGFNDSAYQGYPVGVFGRSNDSGGRGVWGTAPSLGVYGVATAGNGATRGVYGETPSTSGHGVHGLATATSGEANGVYGFSASSSGTGVYGRSPYNGVVGTATGVNGVGVLGRVTGSGHAGFFEGTVRINGDLFVTGDKGFVHEHPNDPTKELVYICLEGGEAGTYIRGTAELRNGEARVELPEHFALVTNAEGVTATLTPVGSYLQLYLAEQAADHLLVREASGKDGQFNYLVQGARKGVENHQVIRDRMPRPEIPEPPLPSDAPTHSGEKGANQ